MNQNNIRHPFTTPEGFFSDFKNEMERELIRQPEHKPDKIRSISLTTLKYAAIIIASFLLGRISMQLVGDHKTATASDYLSVEAVYSQVPEDEITDFIIENSSEDILKQKKL